MPYKNIVFVKLERRLLNDHRFYMMSEKAQLIYVKFLMLACETLNKIPKKLDVLRLALRTTLNDVELQFAIEEIKQSFPKFRETRYLYYFFGFKEHTNYIPKWELPGKSSGLPKELVDKDKDKDKEEERDKEPPAPKIKFLDFILLSGDEHKKLIERFGEKEVEAYIVRLNNYIGSKGKKYKSHYHTILNWKDKDGDNGKQPQPHPSDHKKTTEDRLRKTYSDYIKNASEAKLADLYQHEPQYRFLIKELRPDFKVGKKEVVV